MFNNGEIVILNENAKKDLPLRVGERCLIIEEYRNTKNFDYYVQFDDLSTSPVKISELNKLTPKNILVMGHIFTGNEVLYKPSGEIVEIVKVDYILEDVEIQFDDTSTMVVRFDKLQEIEDDTLQVLEFTDEKIGKFTELALEIGQFTDMKNKQYGSSVDATYKMIQVLMERYTYDEENYLMPKDLLKHILLTVRVMDKQNRIFNNPSGKGDSESPWNDITGYGLIGIDMVQK